MRAATSAMALSLSLALALGCGVLATPARAQDAQDASFGCKVLLCAAATIPGWQAIAYCVPPMTQLLTILRKGGGWPTCGEAQASPVGYQRYYPCADGAGSWSSASPDGSATADPNGPVCAAHTQLSCTTTFPSNNGSSNFSGVQTCATILLDPSHRPENPNPFYVDLTSPTGTQRFNFNLNAN